MKRFPVVLIFFIAALIGVYIDEHNKNVDLKAENRSLKDSLEIFKAMSPLLHDDADFNERIARDNIDFAAPGDGDPTMKWNDSLFWARYPEIKSHAKPKLEIHAGK